MTRHDATSSALGPDSRSRSGGRSGLGSGTPAALLLVLVACGGDAEPAEGPGPQGPGAGPLAGTHVLVTLIDACAADFVTPYGGAAEVTPFLARFASGSHLFEDTTAAAPYTLASVASLFTGEHVDVHGVTRAEQVLPAHLPTLAEAFQRAGHRTLGVSTNAHVRGQAGFARGFDDFHRVRPRLGDGQPHEVPAEVLEHFEALLDDSPRDSPWFAYLHLMPPHAPYTAPLAAREALQAEDLDLSLGSLVHLAPLTVGAREAGAGEAERIARLYTASLHYVDGVLEAVDTLLAERRITEDVLWIVLSDHGEGFGEHGLFQHSSTVYDEMLRVPLIVRLPARATRSSAPGGPLFRPAGSRHSDPVSIVDLFDTLRELYGLEVERPFSSTSLTPLLRGEPFARQVPVVARTAGPDVHRALRLGDLKLVTLPGRERPLLFDLATDPGEQKDVARARRPEARSLFEDQETWRRLARRQRGERETASAKLDSATRAELEAIGYGGESTGEEPD